MKLSFAVKLSLIITLVTSLITGGALAFFYNYSKRMLVEEMKERLEDVGRTGTYLFSEENRELLKDFRRLVYSKLPPVTEELISVAENDTKESLPREVSEQLHKTVEFQYLVQVLRRIQAGSIDQVMPLSLLDQDGGQGEHPPNIFWTYLMVPVPGVAPEKLIMFLADSNYQEIDYNEDGKIEGEEYGNPVGNLYAGDPSVFAKPFKTGSVHVSEGWYEDTWGTFMTAVVPIKGENGEVLATLGLDYLVMQQSEKLNEIFHFSLIIFTASVALALLLSAAIAYMVNQPLYLLRMGVERIKRRDFSNQIPVTSRDEFGLLANTFNQMSREVNEFTHNLEAIVDERTAELSSANDEILKLNVLLKQENQDLGAELDLLLRLRKGGFPCAQRLRKIRPWDIAVQFKATDRVGGDFFDVVETADRQLLMYTGSVSGTGLETGVMALQVKSAMMGLVRQLSGAADPSLILERLNREFYHLNQQLGLNRHVSMELLCQTGNQQLALGGQYENPVLVRTGGAVEDVETVQLGVPLGISDTLEKSFGKISVKLDGSDTIVLLSTGALAVLDEQGVYSDRSVVDIVKQNQRESANTILQKLYDFIGAMVPEAYPEDVTLVVIKRRVQ